MAARPSKKISNRSILVELPEDRMMALVKRAKENNTTAHKLAAEFITERLK